MTHSTSSLTPDNSNDCSTGPALSASTQNNVITITEHVTETAPMRPVQPLPSVNQEENSLETEPSLSSNPTSRFSSPPESSHMLISEADWEQWLAEYQSSLAVQDGEDGALSDDETERLIDESFFEDEKELDSEDFNARVDREDEEDQVGGGVLGEYLRNVLREVKQRVETGVPPLCYKNSTFWMRPADPVFALRNSLRTTGRFDPHVLYSRSVFVWIPQHLPGAPSVLSCHCGNRLSHNGMVFWIFGDIASINFTCRL